MKNRLMGCGVLIAGLSLVGIPTYALDWGGGGAAAAGGGAVAVSGDGGGAAAASGGSAAAASGGAAAAASGGAAAASSCGGAAAASGGAASASGSGAVYPVSNGESYAAIAYSASTGAIGRSGDSIESFPTLEAAEVQAVQSCGADDCRILVWVKNGCASVSFSAGDVYYAWGWSTLLGDAQNRSLTQCRALYGDCTLKTFTCSR